MMHMLHHQEHGSEHSQHNANPETAELKAEIQRLREELGALRSGLAGTAASASALEITKARYARGEIRKQEFEEIRKAID